MSEHWSKIYVRHVVEELGINPSALAQRIGKASTTITRPLNNPDHKHAFGRETLDRIATETGIPYEPFRDRQPSDEAIAASFDQRLAMLPPERRRRVLETLQDQEALHAQGRSGPDSAGKTAEQ